MAAFPRYPKNSKGNNSRSISQRQAFRDQLMNNTVRRGNAPVNDQLPEHSNLAYETVTLRSFLDNTLDRETTSKRQEAYIENFTQMSEPAKVEYLESLDKKRLQFYKNSQTKM